MTVCGILLGGGSGGRAGGEIPKQFADAGRQRIIDWSFAALDVVCDSVVVVLPAASLSHHAPDAWRPDSTWIRSGNQITAGGATRSASVRAGIAALPRLADIVVVHDAARPLVQPDLIRTLIESVRAGADVAVPGVGCVDTVYSPTGVAVDRRDLVLVQTPQVFLRHVLEAVHFDQPEATDDATLARQLGYDVAIARGDAGNFKVTWPEDVTRAAVLLEHG